jgi:hypothetical protein
MAKSSTPRAIQQNLQRKLERAWEHLWKNIAYMMMKKMKKNEKSWIEWEKISRGKKGKNNDSCSLHTHATYTFHFIHPQHSTLDIVENAKWQNIHISSRPLLFILIFSTQYDSFEKIRGFKRKNKIMSSIFLLQLNSTRELFSSYFEMHSHENITKNQKSRNFFHPW